LSSTGAEVLLPGDGEKYQESIKRWSDHCEKRAVYSPTYAKHSIDANKRQACVVRVTSKHDVTTTIQFVREHKIPFVVRYGLVIDNLLQVEMVLASGEQVIASETENEDLFWAVRGAGQVNTTMKARSNVVLIYA
jgi:FAD/FMN-containing dehydrogenase